MGDGITGPEAAKAIRDYEKKIKKEVKVWIVGLTGADEEQEIRDALDKGMN